MNQSIIIEIIFEGVFDEIYILTRPKDHFAKIANKIQFLIYKIFYKDLLVCPL